jgi:uncharacterized Zn-finger protein
MGCYELQLIMFSIFVTGLFKEEQKFIISDGGYSVDGSSQLLTFSFKDVIPMQRKVTTFTSSQPVQSGRQSGIFPCTRCGNIYKYKRSLHDHMRLECGKLPQFQCPYCPYRTKRNGNKLKHIRNMHKKQA